jgi:hypothetical protein
MADQTPKWRPPFEDLPGYWYLTGPGILVEDLENMIFEAGNRSQFLFTVIGTPFYVSPEWDAKHPRQHREVYDYAVSYAIPARRVGQLLDATAEDTAEDFFNMYLNSEETMKGWITIKEIQVVDQKKWKNTYK